MPLYSDEEQILNTIIKHFDAFLALKIYPKVENTVQVEYFGKLFKITVEKSKLVHK